MKLLQEKSDCCHAGIIRFGGKRRQCVGCRKTWRVQPAKRGRKTRRSQHSYLRQVFGQGLAVKQLANHSRLSVDAIYKRFANNLDRLLRCKRRPRFKGRNLILIIDGEWQYFNHCLWTLYLLSIKSVGDKTVTVLDPLLMPGKESANNWDKIFEALPVSIKSRVIALVSDGLKGIDSIAFKRGWILQRCHFHVLNTLQKMRGKRATTKGRIIREEIYQLVKMALSENKQINLHRYCQRLAILFNNEGCPVKMRMAVRDFLRKLPDFRSYIKYPKLCLPTTTNVMESINSLVRRKARTVNSPTAWFKWATACVRFKSKFNCE